MTQWKPDPSFYPSPREAMQAPVEEVAYVAMLNPAHERPDAMGVVDVGEGSPTFGQLIGQVDMTGIGDELHHFGWNACSSCLSPYAPHAHVERRYLVVPGIHSSRIHILDAGDARNPRVVKVVEAEEIAARTGYAAPHTVHCGPDGIYVNALGAVDGDGPGGIFTLDPETFEVAGTLGAGARPPVPVVRLLLAPGTRHHDHQRVGHAEHGDRGTRTPSSCSARDTATRSTCGISARSPTSRSWTWVSSTRWSWS